MQLSARFLFDWFFRNFGKIAAIVSIIFIYSCANVVAPTGGPKDEEPPVVLRMEPPNNTPNFTGRQVQVFFNEFVQVTDINQKLLVSPPMEEMPTVRLRGRTIIVSWDEAMRDSTTYNFFFGDAIADITERNAIPNFQIVFSTGPFVDSLSIGGTVIDAFTLKPSEGVYVMMYPMGNDSLPFLERPVYLAKTDKQGKFHIGNTAAGSYLLFALNDLNANFLFDLPNEQIAFLDTLIKPEWVPPAVAPERGDTVPQTPTQINNRQVANARNARQTPQGANVAQTNAIPTEPVLDPTLPLSHNLSMRMFVQADTIQQVRSATIVQKGVMNLAMRIPFDTLSLRNLRKETTDQRWYVAEPSSDRDTLRIWFLPPMPDTLEVELSDHRKILDTLLFATQPRAARGRETPQAQQLTAMASLNAGQGRNLPFFEKLLVTSNNPIQQFDSTLISLFVNDSVRVERTIVQVGQASRQLHIDAPLEPGQNYTLQILPNALKDVFGSSNDTLTWTFSTTKLEDYGQLILNLRKEQHSVPLIVQLTGADGNTQMEMVAPANGVCRFINIRPGNYIIRVIVDANKNGRWDSGHFLKRIQPERVLLHHQQIQIRPNWESEVNWSITL